MITNKKHGRSPSDPGSVDEFRMACLQAGLKVTPQRLVILEETAKRRDHPDAETVFRAVRRRLPTIALDTVYRTLWTLNELGLVTALGPGTGNMRFDTNRSPHHHFICSRCGAIHDFADDGFDRLRVPASAAAFGRIEMTQVEFRGLCRNCEKKIKKKPKKEKIHEKK